MSTPSITKTTRFDTRVLECIYPTKHALARLRFPYLPPQELNDVIPSQTEPAEEGTIPGVRTAAKS